MPGTPTPLPSATPAPSPSPSASVLPDFNLFPNLPDFPTKPVLNGLPSNHPLIDFALSVGFLVGGFLLAGVINRVVRAQIRRGMADGEQGWADLLAQAVGTMPGVLVAVFGAYLALLNWPLDVQPETHRVTLQSLFVVAALSVTFSASRLAVLLLQRYAANAPGILPTTSIFGNFIKLVVVVLGILIILQSLGISITPILTALGVGGLAVALALQDTLSNLFSGFQIIASRQFAAGDFIRLSTGEEGKVADIAWRNTTIRTLQQFDVVVPNSKLAQSIVTNFGQTEAIYNLQVPFSLAYGTDLEKAETVVKAVGKETLDAVEGGDKGYEPVVRFQSFGDMGIQGQVTLRVLAYTDQYAVRHDFIKRLDARLRADDILVGRNSAAILAPVVTEPEETGATPK